MEPSASPTGRIGWAVIAPKVWLSPQPRTQPHSDHDCYMSKPKNQNRTFHLLRKADILTCYEQGPMLGPRLQLNSFETMKLCSWGPFVAKSISLAGSPLVMTNPKERILPPPPLQLRSSSGCRVSYAARLPWRLPASPSCWGRLAAERRCRRG